MIAVRHALLKLVFMPKIMAVNRLLDPISPGRDTPPMPECDKYWRFPLTKIRNIFDPMTNIIPDYDVIIIGGGPAGLSAALWCSDLGMRAILLEEEKEFGGQLLRTFNLIRNYPGIEESTGKEIRDSFLSQVVRGKVERRTGVAISRVDLASRTIWMEDGTSLTSNAIIIATGVGRRKLGVAGEDEFVGRGILDSGVRNRETVAGKDVVIVGGGDAALENAIILGENARTVTLVHRSNEFRARPHFIETASNMHNVTFRLNTRITSICGDTNVSAVELFDTATAESSVMAADAVLIRVGVMPNTDLFQDQIELDQNGYIKVDAACSTNIEGVFAVGDVANPVAPTIVSAAGMGATAAKNAEILAKRLTDAAAIKE